MRTEKLRTALRVLAICPVILAAPIIHGQIVYLDDFADGEIGRFVMEAENYSNRLTGVGADWFEVDGSDHRWIEGPAAGTVAYTARGGARGNYMESFGLTSGAVPPIDPAYDGPFLDYRVQVETPGAYRLYVRWTASSLSTDSLYAFVLSPDGTHLSGAGPEWFLYHQWRTNWHWDHRGVMNTTASSGAGFPHDAVWTILEPGEYTIRIAMRETYSALDVLVLQTVGLEAPSGEGPPQSEFVSGPIGLAVARIRGAIGSKTLASNLIAETLVSEALVVDTLGELIDSGEYVDRSRGDIVRAREMVRVAMRQQELSRDALERGIAKLEEVLSDLEDNGRGSGRWHRWPNPEARPESGLVIPSRR